MRLPQVRHFYNLLFLLLIVSLVILPKEKAYSALSKYTVSGYVKEKGSGEALIGISVMIPAVKIGTTTNSFGFYTLSFSAADTLADILFSAPGYEPVMRKIVLREHLELDVELTLTMLDEVVIRPQDTIRISDDPQMSSIHIPMTQIKNIPALMGEKDVLKVIQLMPGVQKGNEGQAGMYVRGGGPDQNLIMLDDAVIYNAYHLFGFLSLFNGDALKSVELIKGGFPARYGGRLSSVIEMHMKEGNKERLKGEAGIGLIASKLMLEGPLVKNKSSFLISARRTYLDALVTPFLKKDRYASYYFYDVNAKVNYDFGRKNKIYLSGYWGKDHFYSRYREEDSKTDMQVDWGNLSATFRWNHLFTDKIFANTSLVFSRFKVNSVHINGWKSNKADKHYEASNEYDSYIRDFTFKYDLEYRPNAKHYIRAGVQAILHSFKPGVSTYLDTLGKVHSSEIQKVEPLEAALYVEDVMKLTPRLTLNTGLRGSYYAIDKEKYFLPEPRFGTSYKLTESMALKASYARMNQYVHMLSHATIGPPLDLWIPSTARTLPEACTQYAVGIGKDFKHTIAFTIEGYYKESNRIIGYKEGASYLTGYGDSEDKTRAWEDQIVSGRSWAYGLEFLLHKREGKLSGWIGYTLSWNQVQFDSLNMGKKFYARYDRRHDVSIVAVYKVSNKVSLSATWVYASGNAITLPLAVFTPVSSSPFDPTPGGYRGYTLYSDKNGFRMPAYHRLDLGIQFSKKLKRSWSRTWELSIYNAYNRQNPYFYFIVAQPNTQSVSTDAINHRLKQITLFPVLPSVSYRINF